MPKKELVSYSLTHGQKRIWFFQLLNPDSFLRNSYAHFSFDNSVDPRILKNSIQLLINENDAFRLSIFQENGELKQKFEPKIENLSIESVDFGGNQKGYDDFIERTIKKPFPWNKLYHFSILKFPDNKEGVFFGVNHVIGDASTIILIVEKIIHYYNALLTEGLSFIPEEHSFVHAIEEEREYNVSEFYKQDQKYWLNKFEDVPQSSFLIQEPKSILAKERVFWIDEKLESSIKLFCQKNSLRFYHVLMASFCLFLGRFKDSEDFALGTLTHGRYDELMNKMIGMFVNTLTLRLSINFESMNFYEWIQVFKTEMANVVQHQKYPYDTLIGELKAKNKGLKDLFNIILNYQRVKYAAPCERIFNGSDEYELAFNIYVFGDEKRFQIKIQYQVEQYSENDITEMFESYCALLKDCIDYSDQPVSSYRMVSTRQEEFLVDSLNPKKVEYDLSKCLHEYFEEQVRSNPDNTALIFNDKKYSYHELNERANRLAHYLLDNFSIQPDDRIGLMYHRSDLMIIGMLAVLKSGGAYVPIDSEYPIDRINFIAVDSEFLFLLSEESLIADLQDSLKDLTFLDTKLCLGKSEKTDNPITQVKPNHLVYIIYTSGSTGKPKGVMTEHRGVVNLIKFQIDAYSIKEDEKILLFSEYNFDASLQQIWLAFFTGSQLWLVEQHLIRDPFELSKFLTKNEITHFDSIPAYAKNLAIGKNTSLRRLVVGGDVCGPELLDMFPMDLINEYGPTETTITSIYYHHKRGDPSRNFVPIGKPVANTRVYILDRFLHLVPFGVIGELYIGGIGVSRGYLNREQLTSENFIQNPFDAEERIYKTGDQARWQEDGTIEFLGRVDHQIKIRGHRIEPGEIELSIKSFSGISDCIVTSKSINNSKELIAYYSGNIDNIDQLKKELRRRLPDYMVPSFWVEMERIPVTKIGKIDKKNLPEPRITKENTTRKQLHLTENQQLLVQIWEKLLHQTVTNMDESFFELGGHSLLAVKMVGLVNESFNVRTPLRAFFQEPTIEFLSNHLQSWSENKKVNYPIPSSTNEPYSLSPEQESLWFESQMNEVGATYNMPIRLELKGSLDKNKLESSLNQIVERQGSLRTSFEYYGNKPIQVINSFAYENLKCIRVSKSEVETILFEEACKPFSLNEKLFRSILYEVRPDLHILFLNFHHIISDGWSLDLFFIELNLIYNSENNEPVKLPVLPIQYKDYADWRSRSSAFDIKEEDQKYWEERFEAFSDPFEFPTDFERSPTKTFKGQCLELGIPNELSTLIKKFCSSNGVQLFTVSLAAFLIVLNRLSSSDRIQIGTPLVGRERTEVKDLIGYFVNISIIQADFGDSPNFLKVIKRIEEQVSRNRGLDQIPFIQLVEKFAGKRESNINSLFQVLFTVEHEDESLNLNGLDAHYNFIRNNTAKSDLMFTHVIHAETSKIRLEYNSDLFQPQTIESFQDYYILAFQKLISSPEMAVNQLDLVSEEMRAQLFDYNPLSVDVTNFNSVIDRFQDQVDQYPSKIAIVDGDGPVSYEMLNKRANQLAHYISGLDYQGKAIAVLAGKTVHSVVAFLAVMKSGFAYLPLSPDYPLKSLSNLLNSAEVDLLINTGSIESEQLEKIDVIPAGRNSDFSSEPSENLGYSYKSDDLAYIIFTSGTTGTPNGVQVTNQGILRLVLKTDYFPFEEQHTFVQTAPFNFDASILEIFGALLHGNTFVIYPEKVIEPQLFGNLIKENSATVVWLTSSLFNMIVDVAPEVLFDLKYIFTGGEALSVNHINTFKKLKPEIQLINGYGPTENTTFTCCYSLPKNKTVSGSSVPIGKPIINSTVYVVDKNLILLPPGMVGELLIGGKGLALGYLNNHELTEERFIVSPFEPNEKLYRSGDLVRWLPDGILEYKGRLDRQLKVRGNRIEPKEIEEKLISHSSVTNAAVVKRTINESDALLAYVEGKAVNPGLLKKYLQSWYPSYMVPDVITPIEQLPVTRNGKLDYSALPEYRMDTNRNVETAENEEEISLLRIWEEILNLEKIGVNENFFELGGTSMLAARLIFKLNSEFNSQFQVSAIFQYQTVRELASLFTEPNNEGKELRVVKLKGGSGIPLFLLPGIGGTVLEYEKFLRHTSIERPFYSLDYPPGRKDDLPYKDFSAFVKNILEEILKIQANGPYSFLGYSMAGKVMLELAIQLEEMNKTVEYFGVLSASPPIYSNVTNPKIRRLYLELITFLKISFPEKLKYIQHRLPVLFSKIFNRYGKNSVMNLFIKNYEGLFQLWNEYKTSRKIKSDIYLIREFEREDLVKDFSYYFNRVYRDNYWGYYTSGVVRVSELKKGNHGSLLFDEHVGEVVKIVENHLKDLNFIPKGTHFQESKFRMNGLDSTLKETDVHIIVFDMDQHKSDMKHVSEPERRKGEKFRRKIDRDRFLARKGLIRNILSRYVGDYSGFLEFNTDQKGKPKLRDVQGLEFSVSKSENMGIIAISKDLSLGIDLEKTRNHSELLEIAENHFSIEEIEMLNKETEQGLSSRFLKIWTAKEAIIKADKIVPLSSFSITFNERNIPFSPEYPDWSFYSVEFLEDYIITLAANSPKCSIKLFEYEPDILETLPKSHG